MKTVAIRVQGIDSVILLTFPFLFPDEELPFQDPCWLPSLQSTSSFLSLVLKKLP